VSASNRQQAAAAGEFNAWFQGHILLLLLWRNGEGGVRAPPPPRSPASLACVGLGRDVTGVGETTEESLWPDFATGGAGSADERAEEGDEEDDKGGCSEAVGVLDGRAAGLPARQHLLRMADASEGGRRFAERKCADHLSAAQKPTLESQEREKEVDGREVESLKNELFSTPIPTHDSFGGGGGDEEPLPSIIWRYATSTSDREVFLRRMPTHVEDVGRARDVRERRGVGDPLCRLFSSRQGRGLLAGAKRVGVGCLSLSSRSYVTKTTFHLTCCVLLAFL